MFYVYVLRSETTHRRYVGSCADLPKRLARHNGGVINATKAGVPWILLYSEPFSTRAEAVRRELYFKTGRGRDELEHLEPATHIGAAV
jgi:putative endonuclease